jgi:hypothetical protein
MSSLFKNNLNIPDLFIFEQTEFTSIEFCFLFLTSNSFRNKTPVKQLQQIHKLRNSLGSQIETIINKDTSKNKTLLLNFDENIHMNFLNLDFALGNDFMFVIQQIVKSHAFVIAENKNFYMNNIHKALENKTFLIILKKDNLFYPIFSSNDTFSFPFEHPVIKLINSFNINIDNKNNTYNIDNTLQEKESMSITNNETNVFIVDEHDILFQDFDDEITIKYNNKSFAQKFSDDEKHIYIQNLLSSMKQEKGTGESFLSLIHNTSQVPDSLLDMHLHPVATASKHIEDYREYIDSFNVFKKMDMNKPLIQNNPAPFINPVHYQDNVSAQATNLSYNNDVIRNSFTTSYLKLDNSVDDIDIDDCTNDFSKAQLETIMKYHKISIKGSKNNLCNTLLSFNFLEKDIHNKIESTLSLSDLHAIFKTHSISIDKSHAKSKEKLVNSLIKHNITDFISNLFSVDQLKDVAIRHNVNHEKDFDTLFRSLLFANLLLLSKSNPNAADSQVCHIEDTITAIAASTNTVFVPPNNHLQTFRTIREDNIYINGFYMNGDKTTQKFHVFDVENYFNILFNIKSLLPVKCSMHYFDSTIVNGTIVESIQNNNVLKIKSSQNKIAYYNLKNFLDNDFFLYTEFYEGYKYNKHNINQNIFFNINNYNYDDMIKFISIDLPLYLKLFHTPITNNHTLNNLLTRFNTSFSSLNESDLLHLQPYISSSEITNNSYDTTISSETKQSTKNSIHSFLHFNNNNISDLHKMILLDKQNFFQIIYDIYHTMYSTTHSLDNLDTNVSFSKNTNLKKNFQHQHSFNTFDDLRNHKVQIQKVMDENNNIDLTDREYSTNMYIQNLKHRMKAYTTLLEDFNGFYNAKHEKDFFEEITYTKTSKLLLGSDQGVSLINSDPNNQYSSLEVNFNKHVINEDLDHLSTLIGISLTDNEVTYISNQTKNIFYPFLTKFKLQKNPNSLKTQRDKSLWNHFANTVIYCSFITLVTQYKYNIDNIFNKCKHKFSLHGYPMDDQTDKTFTQYTACVLFTLFGNSNKLFASEQFVDSQITAIIRLIFQHSPSLKTVFNNVTNQHTQDALSPIVSIVNDMKPFYNSKSISDSLKPHIKNALTNNFKIHTINNSNTNTLLVSDPPLQIVSSAPVLFKHMLKLNTFDNIREYTIPPHAFYKEPSDDDNENILDQLTLITNDFKEWSNFSLDKVVQSLVDTFVIDNSDDRTIDNFYHVFKFNRFYSTLLENDIFTPFKQIFVDNMIDFTINIPKLILNMFNSVKSTLEQMFQMNDIYTFLNIEMNTNKRQLFVTFVNTFKTYLSNVVTNFKDSKVDMDTLKNKAEVLREMDKQEKLIKFDNLEDDQMFIIMELEKQLGISIDVNAVVANDEDDPEDVMMTQLSEDDDIPE